MDKDEIKEVAETVDVLSPAVDPTELAETATQADGSENTTDTTGDGSTETTADDAPEGSEDSTTTTESDTTVTESDAPDVSDEEIADLERKVRNLQRKVELTKQLREQTKALLDMGAVLQNTDEPVVTPETVDEPVDEIPPIEETQYVDNPTLNKTEDEEDE